MDMLLDPEQLADTLFSSVELEDMPIIYSILGGPDRALVLEAYELQYPEALLDHMQHCLSARDYSYAASFYHHGKIDVLTRVQAVTAHIWGTDEESVLDIVESATPEETVLLARDPRFHAWTSGLGDGGMRERLLATLGPYLPEAGLTQAEALALAGAPKSVGPDLALLMERLGYRCGYLDDDEDGMVKDARAFAARRGPLDLSEPSIAEQVRPLLHFLEDELSAKQLAIVKGALQTGDKPGLEDQVKASLEETFWGLSSPNEEEIWTALSEASSDERASLWADESLRSHLETTLDADAYARAEKLVDNPAATVTGYNSLLSALDASLWISDAEVFSALEQMSPAELTRLRGDTALMRQMREGLHWGNAERFEALVGTHLPQDESAAALLAADNERLLARIEFCSLGGDTDTDGYYRALIEWQQAGGDLGFSGRDNEIRKKIEGKFNNLAAWSYPGEMIAELNRGLSGGAVTHKQRLRHATADSVVTDDASVARILEDVTDEELIREWSNLAEFRANAVGLDGSERLEENARFVPDLDAEVVGWLRGELGDAVDELSQVRDKLRHALGTEDGLSLAEEEYGYIVDERLLAMLMRRQTEDRLQWARESGATALMDAFSSTGVEGEWSYGEYEGLTRAAVGSGRGSAKEDALFGIAEEKRVETDARLTSAGAERAIAGEIASQVVGTLVGAVLTAATAGTATPILMGVVGSLASGVAGQVAKASVVGFDNFDHETAARELALALAQGLVRMPLKKVSEAAAKGGQELLLGALLEELGSSNPAFATVLDKASEKALAAAVKKYPNDLLKAAFRDETFFRGGLAEHLDSPALDAAAQTLLSALIDGAVDTISEDRIASLKQYGAWDEYLAANVLKGTVDLATATAVDKAVNGRALAREDVIPLFCKMVDISTGATVGMQAAKSDAASTLAWMNHASREDLMAIPNMDTATAEAFLIQREALGSFANLGEVAAVTGMGDQLVSTAEALRPEEDPLAKRTPGVFGAAAAHSRHTVTVAPTPAR